MRYINAIPYTIKFLKVWVFSPLLVVHEYPSLLACGMWRETVGLDWMVVVKLHFINIVFKLYFVPIDVFVTCQFCFGDTWHGMK